MFLHRKVADDSVQRWQITPQNKYAFNNVVVQFCEILTFRNLASHI